MTESEKTPRGTYSKIRGSSDVDAGEHQRRLPAAICDRHATESS